MSLLKNYQQLAKKLHLSEVQQASFICHFEHIDFSDISVLDKRISDANPQQGWLCYQSDIQRFMEEKNLPKRTDQTGYILNAEFMLDESRSLHIRMAEQGWIISELEEQVGTDLVKQAQYLCIPDKDVDEATMGNFKQRLNYRVIWTLDDESGYQPSNYRFTGFSEEAK